MLRPDEFAAFPPRFRTGRTAPCIEYLRKSAQPPIRPASPSDWKPTMVRLQTARFDQSVRKT